MNIPQAVSRLKKLGFDMSHEKWGTIEAEPYDVGKDHFTPRHRDVYIGRVKTGWYITSDIKGKMRGYRCRRVFDTNIGNIIGIGSTLKEALEQFEANFKSKTYNVHR
jgi:hypothetical protein